MSYFPLRVAVREFRAVFILVSRASELGSVRQWFIWKTCLSVFCEGMRRIDVWFTCLLDPVCAIKGAPGVDLHVKCCAPCFPGPETMSWGTELWVSWKLNLNLHLFIQSLLDLGYGKTRMHFAIRRRRLSYIGNPCQAAFILFEATENQFAGLTGKPFRLIAPGHLPSSSHLLPTHPLVTPCSLEFAIFLKDFDGYNASCIQVNVIHHLPHCSCVTLPSKVNCQSPRSCSRMINLHWKWIFFNGLSVDWFLGPFSLIITIHRLLWRHDKYNTEKILTFVVLILFSKKL